MQASFSTEKQPVRASAPALFLCCGRCRHGSRHDPFRCGRCRHGSRHDSSARVSPRRFFSARVRFIMTWCPHPVHFKRKSCPIRRTSQVYAPQGCGFFSLMISPTRISIPLIPPRELCSSYARSFPLIMVKASLYFALVFSTTSSGRRKSLSGFAFSQLRTNCLSKDGCPWPAS